MQTCVVACLSADVATFSYVLYLYPSLLILPSCYFTLCFRSPDYLPPNPKELSITVLGAFEIHGHAHA